MAIWQAQIEFSSVTGIPADKIVSTFNFEGGAGATDTANIDDMIWDFYNESYAGNSILQSFSQDSFGGAADVKIYCMDDPEPRVPRALYEHQFTPSGAGGLPAEVALCMSYHATPVAGQSQARRRGRVYLGPFLESENTSGRPTVDLITRIGAAAAELLAAANASVTWQWIVWSRVNASGANVVGGWVDDAWDTQRRRGVDRTTRYAWS